MNQIVERKNYYMLDIIKFMCAVMVISVHFVNEQCHFTGIVDLAFSVYIFCVPFFFVCSGFLFFEKLKNFEDKKSERAYFISYQKRLWIMYLIWTVIYWCFRLGKYAMYGTDADTVWNNIHSTLTFASYGTIWFLPALAVGIAVVYAVRNLKLWQIGTIFAIIYIIGCLGYSYVEVLEKLPILKMGMTLYNKAFFTTRNGMFHGAPLVAIGYFIAYKRNNLKLSKKILWAVVCSALTLAEALVCKKIISPSAAGADTLFFLAPAVYFIVSAAIMVNLKERKAYWWMRKLSLLMFTSQRLFLSAIPILWPAFMVPYNVNDWLGLVMMNVTVIAFDVLIILLSKKFKFLRYII